MDTLLNIQKAIENAKRIIILSHQYPDGDSMGSSIALYLALKNSNKEVFNVIDDKLPAKFKFLKGFEDIKTPDEVSFDSSTTVIFIDCADVDRVSKKINKSLKNIYQIINIDHHEGNANFGNINYVDKFAAATGEIIFKLLEQTAVEINKYIAIALYTAIATDTGSFKFDNTNSQVFKIAAKLIDLGADVSCVRLHMWENTSEKSIRLLAETLSTLRMTSNSKVSYITVTQKMLKKYNVEMEEIEGFVNYPKAINGVEIIILFKEINDNEIKISFRSKKNYDVRLLAENFGGGGHAKAAGCTLYLPLNEAISKIIAYTEKYLN